MTNLRTELEFAPVPGEVEARERAWRVVETAYREREQVPPRRRSLRPILALAVAAAVAAAALSPPGRSVGGWIQDRVAGEPEAEPALVRLPAPGMVLVAAERGPWIVRADGSKRFLGEYEDASFSPRGRFVVATAGRRVVALEPDGDPRWSLARPRPVADARWSPSPGFRIAYREGSTLRVVAGDGTGDRLLARGVEAVAPAWLPREGRTVVAYARTDGTVRVVDVDSGRELLRTSRAPGVREVFWTPEGLVAARTTREVRVHDRRGRLLRAPVAAPRREVVAAVPLPGAWIVYAEYNRRADETQLVREACFGPGPCIAIGPSRFFRGAGRLRDLTLSPDGRWLLAGWPDADQLLFLRLPSVQKIVAVDDVRREFDPGGAGAAAFPRLAAWCCPVSRP